MTRADALRAMLERVEAGEFPADTSAHELGWSDIGDGLPALSTAYRAFSGSLDAAKALHEAVLQEWGWRAQDVGHPVAVLANGDDVIQAHGETPARAWIIAILKALIAAEDN